MNGTYNRRHYLTAYSKEQHTEFGTIYVDADGTTSSYSGIVSFENGVATLGDAGSATYSFSVSSAGTYDIAIRLCYPFWDKTASMFRLTATRRILRKAGSGGHIGEAPSGQRSPAAFHYLPVRTPS